MFSAAKKVEQIRRIQAASGIEYDTVRGRGDFDAGYVNEYNLDGNSIHLIHRSYSCDSRHKRILRIGRASSSDKLSQETQGDNQPSEINSAPLVKATRRSRGEGRKNLPFKKNTDNGNKTQDNQKTEFHENSVLELPQVNNWNQKPTTVHFV